MTHVPVEAVRSINVAVEDEYYWNGKQTVAIYEGLKLPSGFSRIGGMNKMISRDSLEELGEALRRAGASENNISTAITILARIAEFDPSEDLPKDLGDWFEGQREYSSARSGINFIPGEPDGCHDLLVTVCVGERNFDLNTMETIALCVKCGGIMRAVIIATDYWAEKEFNKWRKSSFEALHDKFDITFFVFTPHAGKWAFDQIIPSIAKGKKRK